VTDLPRDPEAEADTLRRIAGWLSDVAERGHDPADAPPEVTV
jgi:hypothetical protein